MKEKLLKILRTHIATVIGTFAVMFITLLCIYSADDKHEIDKDRLLLAKEQELIVSTQKRLVKKDLGEIVLDLLYLNENVVFTKFINENGPKDDVEKEWLLFSGMMKKYDQIRYLDSSGDEIIRINFNNGSPVKVEAEQLQNKMDRYYFNETYKLDKGEIYQSIFDLNIEDNQIEQPIKPTIRFGLPVFNQEKSKQGIVMINYLGQNIIDEVKRNKRDSNFMQLVNEDGYWFVEPNSENEWAFMFFDNKEHTFKNRFQEEWLRIVKEENGQFFSSSGLFTFCVIYPEKEAKSKLLRTSDESVKIKSADHAWFLISRVPSDAVDYANDDNSYLISLERVSRSPALVLSLLLIAGLFTVVLSLYLAETEKIKKSATYDSLTGCLNRTSGTRLIETEINRAERINGPLSMIILDLDHFKIVNDRWGHPVGDAVLKETARIISEEIRKLDSLIRLGGEEFIVLLPNIGIKGALVVAEKLRVALDKHMHSAAGKVTASFGAAEKKKEESFSEWYERADDALYHAKETGRNRVVSAEDNREMPIASVQLEWKNEWESGNGDIDRQHREMIERGNRLLYLAFSGAKTEEVLTHFNILLNVVARHFDYEEQLLLDSGYPDRKEHAELHKALVAKALKLKEAYQKGELKTSSFFSYIVDDIIIGHMVVEDVKFFAYTGKKG